jgi:two-component system sensor histidine kinase/response regulator
MMDSNFKNANILIVDDKEANIDILVGLLEFQEYKNIKTTTDSRLVVDLLNSFQPDLILLDLMMPYFSGYEVMDQLRELIPKDTFLPILVLTADLTEEAKQRALSGGAKDFIAKPFNLNEVDLRIRNLLQTRFLHQQLKNQNKILDKKVKERTLELQIKNSELIVAKNKAEESDRLKTAFLNNISHEIRTPFVGLLGFLSMIQNEKLNKEDRDEYISIINKSANRLMITINDVIEISQIQAGLIKLNKSEINIKSLIDDIYVQNKKNADSKDLKFIVKNELSDSNKYLSTDGLKLNSILSIFVGNAIKFTLKGEVEINVKLESDFIVFSVKDTGLGIPKNIQKIIFERFMQADVSSTRKYEGMGLGLSIAKAHAEILGGSISLLSEEGKGSVFSISIPYLESVNEEITLANNVLPQNNEDELENLVILIVDDDKLSQMIISIEFNTFSKEVLIANNGIEAVDICRLRKDIDLVLMDIQMPEMDGIEAIRLIREFNTDIIIIAQTAYAFSGDKEKAIKAGCNQYLNKPINHNDMLNIIKNEINKKNHNKVLLSQFENDYSNEKQILECVENLPLSIIKNLSDAIAVADIDLTLSVINSITPLYPELAQYLLKLTNDYNYNEIQELLSKKG